MMSNILEVHTNMHKAINGGPQTKLEQLISDCFDYKIFLRKPTKKHRMWFKSYYGVDYPTEVSELTKSLQKELRRTIKLRKQDRLFEEKMTEQRKKNGYCDTDVWNFNSWLAEMTHKILSQMAKHHMGHPLIDGEGNYLKNNYDVKVSSEIADKKWTEILERMSFLAGELNEETCSMNKEKEELTNKWWAFHEQFEKEYGNGDSLKSQEELDYEKKHNVHIAVFPHRHPDKNFVKEYNKAWKELSTFEKKMFNYQNKCKNELFDMLKKYYWDLWD